MESEKKKKLEQAGWKIGSANEFLDDLTELKSWGLAVPFIETVKERAANDAEFKNELLNETHTEEEYRELIHNIVKHTYRKVVEFKPYVKINLEEMITRSQDYLENEIHTFVKKLDSYLNQRECYLSNLVKDNDKCFLRYGVQKKNSFLDTAQLLREFLWDTATFFVGYFFRVY